MNTPLQKAAKAVIRRWESPAWKDQPHTAEYIAELRKALDAEIAQVVEPVAWTGKGCGVITSATKNRMIDDGMYGGEYASAARVAMSHDVPLYPPHHQPKLPQVANPVAYLAWRDGKPCWDGDECVCEDAVYPVDCDDDRVSMPLYLHPPPSSFQDEVVRLVATELYDFQEATRCDTAAQFEAQQATTAVPDGYVLCRLSCIPQRDTRFWKFKKAHCCPGTITMKHSMLDGKQCWQQHNEKSHDRQKTFRAGG